MNRFLPIASIAAIFVLAAACGGGDDDDATAEPDPVTQSATTGTAATTTQAATSAATGQAGPDAKLPEDPCKLVSVEQVGALLTSAGAGRPAKEEPQPGVSLVACTWAGNPSGGLNVVINTIPQDARKSAGDRLRAMVRSGSAKEVSGLGEAAASATSQQQVTVFVVVKGLAIEIGYSERVARDATGPGAAAKLDAVIALARAVVAKL